MNRSHFLIRMCRVLVTVYVGSFVVSGCEPQHKITRADHLDAPHHRALRENPQRVAIGLRPVNPQWICFRSTPDGGDEWLADLQKDPAAIKVVKRKADGSLMDERDTYFSGRIYQPEDGSPVPEAFVVWYDYSSKKFMLVYSGNNAEVKKLVSRAEEDYASEGKIQVEKVVAEVLEKWDKESK